MCTPMIAGLGGGAIGEAAPPDVAFVVEFGRPLVGTNGWKSGANVERRILRAGKTHKFCVLFRDLLHSALRRLSRGVFTAQCFFYRSSNIWLG
jgi:hypothetical protein